MHRVSTGIAVIFAALLLISISSAQSTSNTAVPALINFSGTLTPTGSTIAVDRISTSTRTVGVTFAIYRQQEGGAPVWLETQNVSVDATGHYSVLLGSTQAEGLPTDLFSAQEERWLGVKAEGRPEQPRVMLVSVPYAFKAHEAETLGGLPASAFLQASQSSATSAADTVSAASISAAATQSADVRIGLSQGHGTKGYVPIWINPLYLSNSALFQDSNKNVGIGTTAPAATLDVNGSVNSATGYQIAGNSVLGIGSTGDYNLFLGIAAGANNVAGQGQFNTFTGQGAGYRNTTGRINTANGYNALFSNTTGSSNAGNGADALYYNTTGSNNTANGVDALVSNTTGNNNTASGASALIENTTGSNNTASGQAALQQNTTGNSNTAIGLEAAFANTTGSFNLSIGRDSGASNATGSSNIYFNNYWVSGESSTIRIGTPVDNGQGTQTAAYIAGISGAATSSGVPVFIDSTGKLGTSGGSPGGVTSFNGRTGAVVSAAGDYNFTLLNGFLQSPQLSGTYSSAVTLSNGGNSFTGNGVGLTGVLPAAGSPNYIQNTTAQQAGANFNISGNGSASGTLSGSVVNAGTIFTIYGVPMLSKANANNLFVGPFAGNSDTPSGSDNVFAGYQTGYNNTSGSRNAFTGSQAGFSNIDGSNNIFTGTQAGYSNTDGGGNIYIGDHAGHSNANGKENTFVGDEAGYHNTGAWNTFYGWQAAINNTSGYSNIYIGNSGTNESNTIRIGTQGTGNGQQNQLFIAGIPGVVASGGIAVYVNSNGQLGTATSSRRFKEQIRDMGDSTSGLMKLRPVTFLYKPEYDKGPRTLQYGLIAEEVAEVYPDLVAYEPNGQPYTVKYQYLTTMLLNELQKEHRKVEELTAELQVQSAELKKQNDGLQQRLARVEILLQSQMNSFVAQTASAVSLQPDGTRK